MKVHELLREIEDEAFDRAHTLQIDAKREVQRIEQETARMLAEKRKKMVEEVRKLEAEQLARDKARSELEARKKELALKQELLDKAFDKALAELSNRKGKPREKILSKLWKKAREAGEIQSVEVCSKDVSFFKGKSKVSNKLDCAGGFIAHGKDIKIDLRFETLLEQVRENKLDIIAEALFG